jgi:preprotein translocase subunit SecY
MNILDSFRNIFAIPDLRKRVIFSFLLLGVYRIGSHIPTPGLDAGALEEFFRSNAAGLLGFLDIFSGGALERFSIFALGIMPYISSSIILQLLTVVFPYLEKLSKEGELGRRKIKQYTRYGTILLSVIQGTFISMGLERIPIPGGGSAVYHPGWSFRAMTVITLTSGTAFIMWLGEQITERGIGNGISLIIFAGIVANFPSAAITTYQFFKEGEISLFLLLALVAFMVLVIGVIIFFERAARRIPVHYAKRVVGRKMYGGQTSHLPLKINPTGVIPPIFASSILIFPATIAQIIEHPNAKMISDMLVPGTALYDVVYVGLIIFFCYFYTAVTFNPTDVADNMKKYGGYVPGFRPGQRTAEYIDRILTRITLVGALYISVVCILPTLLIRQANVPFYFGGTALLIVVGVALDTVAQMETHLLTRIYDGFMKRGRIRG